MPVTVVGSINLDIVHRVERLPRPGETVASLGVQRFMGGKGANQAVAAARAGAVTRMIGAVGGDAAGAELLALLQAEAVNVAGVSAAANLPTGSAVICVDAAGENLIVVSAGANVAVSPVLAPLAGEVLLAQLEIPLAAIEAVFSAPGPPWGRRILNAAPALAEAWRLFDQIDLLVVNETELAVFAGLAAPPATAAACLDAAAGLALGRALDVIVTRGAAGAVALAGGAPLEVQGVPAEAVDTTGAGDCFCGALAARLAADDSLAIAMAFANAAAALSVTRTGASASMPTAHEIGAFMAPG